jgi:hypothetical protein
MISVKLIGFVEGILVLASLFLPAYLFSNILRTKVQGNQFNV